MTATASAPPVSGPSTRTRAARPSVARLTLVELRKMTDTRAGFWLLVVVGLLAAGMAALQLFTGTEAIRTFGGFFAATLMAVSLLLPVLGVLSVTSEWSQRAAVPLFLLVPLRWRSTAAKLLAGTVLAALSVVLCLGVAALANLLVGPLATGGGSWTIDASLIATGFLFETIYVIMGMAFGMVLMNTPAAIVLYFLLPTVFTILGRFLDAMTTAAAWLDQTVTLMPLTTGELSGQAWAQIGATVGLWVVLPLAAGLVRLMRREVS